MSNELYPALPGLHATVRRSPQWQTHIAATPSGREFRWADQFYPRREYSLRYEWLQHRQNAPSELATIEGFFNRHRGPAYSFLFNDPEDNAALAEPFGVGNGSATVFRLARNRGGFTEPIKGWAPTPQLYSNGSLLSSGYTLAADGTVTFTAAPASGAALTWSGTYYWRVRFAADTVDFERFLFELWSAGQVKLITVKEDA